MASRYNLGLMQDEGLNPFLPYSPTIFVGIIPGSRHYRFSSSESSAQSWVKIGPDTGFLLIGWERHLFFVHAFSERNSPRARRDTTIVLIVQ